ncbi:hypothetical protein ABT072_47040 [Streptomyces sp. NPDC002589]|uniref:hypothetical protein n=1 Tax=Streptomyces sp. NPDC002589 TaxID=3154420 RepID=UPI00331DC9F7
MSADVARLQQVLVNLFALCRKGGYTKGIRPPEAVTRKEKELNAASYGYKGSLKDSEYDHLLSGVATACGSLCPRQNISGMPLRQSVNVMSWHPRCSV